jgi:hypothetical protein
MSAIISKQRWKKLVLGMRFWRVRANQVRIVKVEGILQLYSTAILSGVKMMKTAPLNAPLLLPPLFNKSNVTIDGVMVSDSGSV